MSNEWSCCDQYMVGEEKESGSDSFGYGGAELKPQCAEEKVPLLFQLFSFSLMNKFKRQT